MVREAWTLNDYLFHLFETQQTESAEFKTLIRIYGRERIEKTWHEYREKRKSVERPKEKFSRFHPQEKEDDG